MTSHTLHLLSPTPTNKVAIFFHIPNTINKIPTQKNKLATKSSINNQNRPATMKSVKTHLLILLILHTHLSISSGHPNSGLGLLRNGTSRGGDAVVKEEEEFQMDSEVSRRVLEMEKRYISYETLKRDAVPCSTPGASYYNCEPPEANRYNRGCEVITRCARSIGN